MDIRTVLFISIVFFSSRSNFAMDYCKKKGNEGKYGITLARAVLRNYTYKQLLELQAAITRRGLGDIIGRYFVDELKQRKIEQARHYRKKIEGWKLEIDLEDESIIPNVFLEDDFRDIEVLHVFSSNKLCDKLDKKLFAGLKKVHFVDLSGCDLDFTSNLNFIAKNMKNVCRLNLAYCSIKKLRKGLLRGFCNLERLSLDGNPLRTFDPDVFDCCSKLRQISLCNTYINFSACTNLARHRSQKGLSSIDCDTYSGNVLRAWGFLGKLFL